MCAWAAFHRGRVDRGRGADWQSHFGGNLRCADANLSKTVANLLASIKLQAYSPPLPIETDRSHVANGTYFMDGSFSADKSYCNNRLTTSYNPNAPAPTRWLQFLSEQLQEDDIPTLQEFLGYEIVWQRRK